MATSFTGKTVLVTGGNSGIGLGAATHFANAGATVFITGRRQAELDKAVKSIGGSVFAVQADSSKLSDLDRVFETIGASGRKLDAVFANAGILERESLGSITEDSFDRLYNINVKGIVFTVQKALPHLRDGASIILTSSIANHLGMAGNSIYASTKAAIRSLARGWMVELKDRHIRVNAVSPGAIETPGLAAAAPTADAAREMFDYFSTHIPTGRVGTVDEIARAVLFLASDDSAYVNGSELVVDGGWIET